MTLINRARTLDRIQKNEALLDSFMDSMIKMRLGLAQVEGSIQELEEIIEKDKASIAPIRRIPPEVLYRIFLCMLGSETYHTTLGWDRPYEDDNMIAERARRLSLVCKEWHSVIETGPRLWTTCAFHEG